MPFKHIVWTGWPAAVPNSRIEQRGCNAGQVIPVPIAHGEGNYIVDAETLKQFEGDGRGLFAGLVAQLERAA